MGGVMLSKRYYALLIASFLYLIGTVLYVTTASAATYPCFGAPADYAAHFNINYPEPRVYREVQGWLTPVGLQPGFQSEHISTGYCFPQGETWAPGSSRMDAKHHFFNLRGYKVTQIRGGMVNTGVDLITTSGQLAELNTAAKASSDHTLKVVFQSYTMNANSSNTSGRKESRLGLKVVKDGAGALVQEWFTSTGWVSLVANGKTVRHDRPDYGTTCRNWASGFDYGNNGFGAQRASVLAQPVTAFSFPAGMASGVNRGSVHVDPDFHTNPVDTGSWSKSLTGEQTVTISGISPGVHQVRYLGHEGGGSKITSTVVCGLPIRLS